MVSRLGKREDMVLFSGMEFGARVNGFLLCLLPRLDHGCIGKMVDLVDFHS